MTVIAVAVTNDLLGKGLLLVVLLMLSFFFSGSETALFSLQKVDRSSLGRSGTGGERVNALLSRKHALITTLLMGNETVNVALATTSAAVLVVLAPGKPWLNIVLLTPVLVLLSEVTPKVLAFRFNRSWARRAAVPLTLFYTLMTPLRWILAALVSSIARLFGARSEEISDALEEEELLVYLERGTETGSIAPRELDFAEAVFDFDDLTVERLMSPRPDIFALPLRTSWDQLTQRCLTSGFSRVPIYNRSTDSILGILLIKDLLKLRSAPIAGPLQLRSLLLPPVFVPTSKPADDMLEEFLAQRYHMAFVVDEHGTLVGLVTLDDLLDELLGEADDGSTESDLTEHNDGWIVRANMDIEDFTEDTSIELPEGDYHTLGGYVFHELGCLPKIDDRVRHGAWTFSVAGMKGRRISSLHVLATTEDQPSDAEEDPC
jgi:CBS domain containing-hemolysin-like protein